MNKAKVVDVDVAKDNTDEIKIVWNPRMWHSEEIESLIELTERSN